MSFDNGLWVWCHAGEVIDGGGVIVLDVLVQGVGGFFVGPVGECGALALVFVEWDAEAAGVGDACAVDANEGTQAGVGGELFLKFGEVGVGVGDDLSLAVEAYDFRRAVEGAEHEDDSAVFFEVGDGFDARADEVGVDDGVVIEDSE